MQIDSLLESTSRSENKERGWEKWSEDTLLYMVWSGIDSLRMSWLTVTWSKGWRVSHEGPWRRDPWISRRQEAFCPGASPTQLLLLILRLDRVTLETTVQELWGLSLRTFWNIWIDELKTNRRTKSYQQWGKKKPREGSVLVVRWRACFWKRRNDQLCCICSLLLHIIWSHIQWFSTKYTYYLTLSMWVRNLSTG